MYPDSEDWNQAKGRGRPLKPFFERVRNARKSSESWNAALKRVKRLNEHRRTKSKERKDEKKKRTPCSKHAPPCPSYCKNHKGKCVKRSSKKRSSSKKSSKKVSSRRGNVGPRFVPSPEFRGSKTGYKFTTGNKGTGYYKDTKSRKVSSKKSSKKNSTTRCSKHKPPCPSNCVAHNGKCVTVKHWLKSK